MNELFTYGEQVDAPAMDLEGFSVEATDGHIGSVDAATYDVGDSYLVVDTGFWIFGKRRLIPAQAIQEINIDGEQITLTMSKDQVKDAPDYDEQLYREDEAYRSTMVGYYSSLWPY